MPTPRPLSKYACTQAELYAICKIGWGSYAEYLADFTAFKTLYTAAYGTTALAEVNAAEELPDDQARGAASEMLRIELAEAADTAILKWKALRAYIKSAYPEAMVKPQEEAAGYDYYATATNYAWEDLEQMLISGDTFITANSAELTTGGMPAGFAAAYTSAMDAFSDLYDDFKAAELTEPEGTDEKIVANNAIYDKLAAMFADGQIIFDGVPATRERFIFAHVKGLVTTPVTPPETEFTTITISGKVTNSATTADLPGAQVVMTAPGAESVVLVTNATGDYSHTFDAVPVGEEADVDIHVSAEGFEDAEETIHVVAGNSYTQNYELTPAP